MGKSPYELAFGQPPHGTVFPGEAAGIVNDLEDLLEVNDDCDAHCSSQTDCDAGEFTNEELVHGQSSSVNSGEFCFGASHANADSVQWQ